MVQGLASGSVGSWHEVPRTSLGLRSASVVAEQTSPGRLATHLPQGYGRGRAGAHGSKVSASVVAEQTSSGRLAVSAPLRSAQNRHPPDVLRPIFRKTMVVVEQEPYID